jgi:hypothetical protein
MKSLFSRVLLMVNAIPNSNSDTNKRMPRMTSAVILNAFTRCLSRRLVLATVLQRMGHLSEPDAADISRC